MYFNGHHLRAHAPFFSSFWGTMAPAGDSPATAVPEAPRSVRHGTPDAWVCEKNMISDRGQHDHPYIFIYNHRYIYIIHI